MRSNRSRSGKWWCKVDNVQALREELRITLRIMGIRWRGQMAYRASFWMQISSNFIVNAAEVLALFAMFYRFDTMGGWTLAEVAFLHGVSMVTFSVADTLVVGLNSVPTQIRQGEFDRVLIRPMSSWLQSIVSEVSLRHVGQLTQGALVFGYALTHLSIDWTIPKVLVLLMMFVPGIVLFASLFTVEAILSFWTVNSVEAVNAFTYGGSDLAQFPLHIFGRGLRFLFLWIIPVGFVSYYPSLYILDKKDPLGAPDAFMFLGPVIVTLFCLLVGRGWSHGIRHYRSTGS
jgi:ABC-2 type transport system permease protein